MDLKIYLLGGLASVIATIFTNPLEVVKIRMQLQGELSKKGTYVTPYKNVLHAFTTIAHNDGLVGLQKGLIPAVAFQFILNSTRLSIYTACVNNGWTKNTKGDESLLKGAICGGLAGVAGMSLSSPLFLIKTQLQSQSVKQISVGFQHGHQGIFAALKNIIKNEGKMGLYRSVLVTIPRGFLGSGGQLATFGYTKEYIYSHNIFKDNPPFITLISGMLAGTIMSITISPPDVIATRLYNQKVNDKGRGVYYDGVIDCFYKILKSEGPAGFYKGFWAQYLRIGPHVTIVLFIFETSRNYIV